MAESDTIPAGAADSHRLADLPWRTIGPFRGGRVTAVAGCPKDRQVFYMGATGGGVWKTADGGITWGNLSDGWIQTGSVGAVAVAPSDPKVIYVGMGECSLRGDVSHGDGVYKSTDAGSTWRRVGLQATRHIAKIVIDPGNPDRLYVAALGPLAEASDERGVFRSLDGGATWSRVLADGDRVGAIDLRLDPHDHRTLYAATWEVRRRPWGFAHAGPGSAVYKSIDGGDTWQKLSGAGGLPGGSAERIALACSAAKEGRVWALVSTTEQKGLYLSDDRGEHWRRTSDHPKLFVRPFYFNHLQADPQDAEAVFVLNYRLWKSTDTGETFEQLPDFHADHHDLWIDPRDARRMIDGCDGGACVSFNGGQTWTDGFSQPTAQFYSCTIDDSWPYNVLGPQQDWSTVAVPSRGWSRSRGTTVMHDMGVSEAGTTQVDPSDPDRLVIGDHQWLVELNRRTGGKKYIAPSDELNYGWGTRDVEYRFAWSFPVVLSRHNPKVLYVASQYVHRSRDRGRTWEVLSGDLTLADPNTLEPTPGPDGAYPVEAPAHWGPITRDSNGDQWYASIITLAESPRTSEVLWTGSDDGLVHVSRDGGATWTDVTPPQLPRHTLISKIDPSPHADGGACLAANRYRAGDYEPYLLRTDDYGQSWRRIDSDLPRDDFARVVRWDPESPDLLYCGVETGAYVTLDGGGVWTRLEGGLPRVPVHDLAIKNGELVAATHGRGFWILDHLHALRELAAEPTEEGLALMAPGEVVLPFGPGETPGRLDGLAFAYRLEKQPGRVFHAEVHDAQGRLVSRRQWLPVEGDLSANEEEGASGSAATEPGLHLTSIELTYPDEVSVPGAIIKGDIGIGPIALPGEYRLTVTADDDQRAAAVRVVNDPRSTASADDLTARFEFGIRIRDELTRINRAILRLREARETTATGDGESTGLSAEALTAIEFRLIQHRVSHSKQLHAKPIQVNDKLYVLANRVAASDAAPTVAQQSLFERLTAEAEAAIADLEAVLAATESGEPGLSD